MKLNDYVTLGRSGLLVSPLALGCMTFGLSNGWGIDEADAGQLLDLYLERGGNFLDTADGYTEGRSEEILGRLVRDRQARDRVVVATKFTFNGTPGNPNGGGNGRKNCLRALEGSLRRLGMDYVDLYWVHAWDTLTPVDELAQTLHDVVRSGKARYVGLSDVPAWHLARFNTLAELRGLERVVALQVEYSLVERTIEREHVPACEQLGVGITPWSPLAGGFLTGKYRRPASGQGGEGEGRLQSFKNPVFERFLDKNWKVLDALLAVSQEVGRSPAEVALAWVVSRPGVTSTILGATKRAQLEANIASLSVTLTDAQRAALDAASALPPAHPYVFFEGAIQAMISGNTSRRAWS